MYTNLLNLMRETDNKVHHSAIIMISYKADQTGFKAIRGDRFYLEKNSAASQIEAEVLYEKALTKFLNPRSPIGNRNEVMK